MCSRYLLLKQHLREILERLGIAMEPAFRAGYNIAPGRPISVVRSKPATAQREATILHWGLVPSWAKSDEAESQLVNARSETLTLKPSFRDAFKSRRCVIPASGFYEWQTAGRTKKPWLFRRRDEQPFGLAGLWESWRAPDGVIFETCAVITTEPNEVMQPIHHRMPVMLAPDQFEPWLARDTSAESLGALLATPPAASMSAVAVSPFVSNVQHEGPECLVLADDPNSSPQLSLGF